MDEGRKGLLPAFYRMDVRPEPNGWDGAGRLRPSELFALMQNAATAHAVELRLGRDDLLEKDVVWVLSRVSYALREPIRYGARFGLVTWPGAPQKYLFPRWFRIEDEHGAEIGSASSVWLLVDEKEHRIAMPGRLGLTFPDTQALGKLPLPGKLREPDGMEDAGVRVPLYSDIDLNRHMNNARYVEWVCDALPFAWMMRGTPRRLQVNYVQEALPMAPVRLWRRVDGDAFFVRGESEDGELLFQAAGEWAEVG